MHPDMTGTASFQRARRPEHKQQRREALPHAAPAPPPPGGGQRGTPRHRASTAGVAKTNVLRYFQNPGEIHTPPPALAAVLDRPELCHMRIDFPATLRRLLRALLTGLLAGGPS